MSKSVFISSTSIDLREYRAIVDKVIRRLGLRPINMDDFGSQPGGASGVSLREVAKADIFVGIIAQRYGYVPDGMDISITEQEYNEAIRLNRPRLMYLLDPNFAWPADRVESDETAQHKLATFKGRIEKKEVRSLFTTVDDLSAKVTSDLSKLLDKEQSRQLINRFIIAFVIFAALIALVIISVPNFRNRVIEVVGLSSSTPTFTGTSTATNTLIPTTRPTIIPTALDGIPFSNDKVGIVFADFKHIAPDVANVEDNLESEMRSATIPFIRVKHSIANSDEAKEISDLYNATIVIWGEIDRVGARIYFDVTARQKRRISVTLDEIKVSIPDRDSFDAYVFNGMDILYVVYFIEGQISLYEHNNEKAIQQLNAAEKLIPPDRKNDVKADSLYYFLGIANSVQNQYDLAIVYYNYSVDINPNNENTYINRAGSYYQQGEYEKAVGDYDNALHINPQNAMTYYFRGYANYSGNKLDDAIADYTQSLQLDATYVPAYVMRGIAYDEQKQYDSAIADYNAAIQLNPQFYDAYRNRGTAYYEQGEFQEALDDYATTIKVNPRDTHAYYMRGVLYRDQGNLDAAIADYTQAIKLDSKYSNAYWGLGNAYYELKMYKEAIESYRTYGKLVGKLEPFMEELITEMQKQLGVSTAMPTQVSESLPVS